MANICSVDFNFIFKTQEYAIAFILDFNQKIKTAQSINEGVPIAESDWLFDAAVQNTGNRSAELRGWVRGALSQETMQVFTEYLQSMNMESFECGYEETGNLVYGKYSYENGELWECSLDECHPIWEKANSGEDDYFDEIENALETDGVMEQIA
jgi:hypothetical protein